MRLLCFSMAILVCFASVSVTNAQNGDPFGGGGDAAANPFNNNGAGADPFAGNNQNARPVLKPQLAKAKPKLAAKKGDGRDVAPGSEAEARIRSSLNDLTTQTFVETPLNEVIHQLSRSHDIPIILDRRAMEEIGLSDDTPVNLDLKNVTLRSFVRLMLRDFDMTYMVKNEVLQITTVEFANTVMTTEAYPIPESLADMSDKVIEALIATVHPDTWDKLGGPSSISAVDHVLMVSTTEETHQAVIDFLTKLQTAYEKHQASR